MLEKRERLNGFVMADDHGRGATRPGAKDARQDRLKLALRENLKRRKVQARERGQVKGQDKHQGQDQEQSEGTEPSSTDHEACLDGQVGKRSG
jgi:hypothetical protein